MVRWSMRPAGGTGKFTVVTDFADGQVRLVDQRPGQKRRVPQLPDMNGTAVGPDMQPLPMKIDQTAPGRYVGEFSAKDARQLFRHGQPRRGQSPIRTGINVPYSDEFREQSPNEALLDQLAAMTPKDGKPGALIEAENHRRRTAGTTARCQHVPARSAQGPQQPGCLAILVAGGRCLFFADISSAACKSTWPGCRRWPAGPRLAPAPPAQAGQRPRTSNGCASKKAEVAGQIEQLRGAVRFEMPQAQKPADITVLEEPSGAG